MIVVNGQQLPSGGHMKLAVFSGQYFWFDGKQYSTDEAFVEFVNAFHPYFGKIVFCDAVSAERKTESYVLDAEKAEVCPLPAFNVYSFWENIFVHYPRIYRIVKKQIDDWDIVWLPGPHPVGLLLAYVCHQRRKAFFQMVRANLLEQVKHSNRGFRRCCAMTAVAMLEYASRRIARKHLTFAVGREMYEAYRKSGGNVHETRVSLITDDDIEKTIRGRTVDLHRPVRLLSVARLDPEKGLMNLIRAVEALNGGGRLAVMLEIVGKGYKGREESRLKEEVERRHLSHDIRFSGYVPFGPRLLELYRESDIFVLPSLSGEGVPQTVFEAMACGIPIVATRVGGIPDVIQHERNGLLIDAGSPEEIVSAVERMIVHGALRQAMRENALATVRKHTLEAERRRILERIEESVVGLDS